MPHWAGIILRCGWLFAVGSQTVFLVIWGLPFNRFMRFAGVKHDILEDDNVRQIVISPNFTYGFTRVFTGSLTGSPTGSPFPSLVSGARQRTSPSCKTPTPRGSRRCSTQEVGPVEKKDRIAPKKPPFSRWWFGAGKGMSCKTGFAAQAYRIMPQERRQGPAFQL